MRACVVHKGISSATTHLVVTRLKRSNWTGGVGRAPFGDTTHSNRRVRFDPSFDQN
jgi:hypothetical protein